MKRSLQAKGAERILDDDDSLKEDDPNVSFYLRPLMEPDCGQEQPPGPDHVEQSKR